MAALSWAALGLMWAQVLVLPDPVLPAQLPLELSPTPAQRFIVMLGKETSLVLTAFALLGLLVAVLARRTPTSSLFAAAACAASVLVSLAPVVQAWRAAAAEGQALSPAGYLAGFSSAEDRTPETVTYARPEGVDLKLDVWRPQGKSYGTHRSGSIRSVRRGRPAVIVVHGGGWHAGSRSQFPRWDAWLADRGYVVFDIDYRLAPPARWQEAPADVRCAVSWVKENSRRYGVDPERVALMGRSAGGHLALLTAYTPGPSPPHPAAMPDTRRTPGWPRSWHSIPPRTSPGWLPWATWAGWVVSSEARRTPFPSVTVCPRPWSASTPATRPRSWSTGATTR